MGPPARDSRAESTLSEKWCGSFAFHNVCFRDKGRFVLKGAYGFLEPGTLCAIMGPSGAGKSTLLKTLAGVLSKRKCSGEIFLGSHLVFADHSYQRKIGYMKQDEYFVSHSTVRETLLSAAALGSEKWGDLTELKAQVDIMIERLGLRHLSRRYTKRLSGGERKRLGIGVQLLLHPQVIFCDEPTSGLDVHAATQVMSVLRSVADEGAIVLCTIHQPNSQIFCMFNQLMLLGRGEMYFSGSVKDCSRFFRTRGFVCPKGWSMADFYIEALCDLIEKRKLIDMETREDYEGEAANVPEATEPSLRIGEFDIETVPVEVKRSPPKPDEIVDFWRGLVARSKAAAAMLKSVVPGEDKNVDDEQNKEETVLDKNVHMIVSRNRKQLRVGDYDAGVPSLEADSMRNVLQLVKASQKGSVRDINTARRRKGSFAVAFGERTSSQQGTETAKIGENSEASVQLSPAMGPPSSYVSPVKMKTSSKSTTASNDEAIDSYFLEPTVLNVAPGAGKSPVDADANSEMKGRIVEGFLLVLMHLKYWTFNCVGVNQYHAGFLVQVAIVVARKLLEIMRTTSLIVSILIAVGTGAAITLLWSGNQGNYQTTMLILVYMLAAAIALPIRAPFQGRDDRGVFLEERDRRLLRTSAYVLGHNLVNFPLIMAISFIYSLFYFASFPDGDGGRWFFFFHVLALVHLCFDSMFYAAGFFFGNPVWCQLMIGLMIGASTLGAGAFVLPDDIPGYLLPLHWCLPLKYAYTALLINHFHNTDSALYLSFLQQEESLEAKWWNFAVLLVIAMILRAFVVHTVMRCRGGDV